MRIKSLKYTVQITIDQDWISDGFRLTEDNIRDAILSQLLPHAREHEVKVKIIARPEEEAIAAVQGDNRFYIPNLRKFRKVRKPVQAIATAWR